MAIKNPDTLLVFATAPGKTASDGTGAHSPFTLALLQNMREPGVDVELVMKRVTRDVVQATKGEQVPERLSRLTSEFVFNQSGERASPKTDVSSRLPASSTERPSGARPSSAAATSAACLPVGAALTSQVRVQVGSRLCADQPPDFAEIREIGRTWVTYGENGGFNKSCEVGKLCRFGWSGSPLFTVSIAQDSAGVKTAVLLPRQR
jgi:hypothetical protein